MPYFHFLKKYQPLALRLTIAGSLLLSIGFSLFGVGCLANRPTNAPAVSQAQTVQQGLLPDGFHQEQWDLVLDEQFDDGFYKRLDDEYIPGEQPGSKRWMTTLPWQDGYFNATNGELQYYNAKNRQNAKLAKEPTLQKNTLRLIAEKRVSGQNFKGMNQPYTSAVLSSEQGFGYGYYEMKAKMPRGKALWPAFWLRPVSTDDWMPELDVMEYVGQNPTVIQMNYHYALNGEHQQEPKEFAGPDFSQGFHTFGLLWQSDKLVWYVDGKERYRISEQVPRQTPMRLIANHAVGDNTNWVGRPDASSQGAMEIVYIRAFRLNR